MIPTDGTFSLDSQLVPHPISSHRLLHHYRNGSNSLSTPTRHHKSPNSSSSSSTNLHRHRHSTSAIQARSSSTATSPLGTPTTLQRVASTDPSGQPAGHNFQHPLCGTPSPLGSSILPTSTSTVNFAVVSSNAWGISLCLFTLSDLKSGRVTEEIPLHPIYNKTGDVWHISLPALQDPSLLYGYRVFGPNQDNKDSKAMVVAAAAAGQRMDPTKVLLDPYAKAIINGRLQFGEMGPDLPYKDKEGDVLGLAATWPQAACALPAGVGVVGKSSSTDNSDDAVFDWQGDRPLNIPMEDLVIYEAHVRGFTADPSSGVNAPGTYAGLTERLDYLKGLGINALELMPIQEFNELEYYDVTSQYPRYNYWGYSTVGFFAPMARYSAAGNAGEGGPSIINEFKMLVREAHKRGIEVILDVVFNHTAEGNENGPCLSFRGLDNRVYYMLAPEGQYYNYSGCGNTMNCNHPNVRQFILDCLRYWVEEMHVDGFRFDLGSILTRAHSNWHPATTTLDTDDDDELTEDAEDERNTINNNNGELIIGGGEGGGHFNYPGAYVNEHGHMTDGSGVPTGTPLSDPPLVAAISEDPLLANVKLIAEAWDCDGLNQVGAFPHYGGRWSEWNGHFRDTVRQFIKGTDGPWVGNFAAVLCGSPHIYLHDASEEDWWGYNDGKRWKGGRGPTATVNFVTAHDGFTLADLVSYNEKHNEANGEENRDGESHNLSWNCGEEGETEEPGVMALRSRQMRNMLCALFLAHGVPMLLMGDEVSHSKGGNNNTYCHDSELNWLNWDAVRQDDTGLLRFVKGMIAFRMSKRELRRSDHVRDGEIEWHGVVPSEPDWTETSRLVAFTMKTGSKGGGIYVAFNTSHKSLVLDLPVLGWEGRTWQPFVDTGKSAPFDCLAVDEVLSEEDVEAAKASTGMWTLQNQYPMLPWSCVILESVVVGKRAVMPAALRGGGMGGGGGGGGEKKKKKGKKAKESADA